MDVCPKCQAAWADPGLRFCPSCGSELSPGAKETVPDSDATVLLPRAKSSAGTSARADEGPATPAAESRQQDAPDKTVLMTSAPRPTQADDSTGAPAVPTPTTARPSVPQPSPEATVIVKIPALADEPRGTEETQMLPPLAALPPVPEPSPEATVVIKLPVDAAAADKTRVLPPSVPAAPGPAPTEATVMMATPAQPDGATAGPPPPIPPRDAAPARPSSAGGVPPPPPAGTPPPTGGGGSPPAGRRSTRQGTPWDRRGELGLATALIDTTKQALSNPAGLYRAMALKGGLPGPLLYGMTLGACAVFVSTFYGLILGLIVGGPRGFMSSLWFAPMSLGTALRLVLAPVLVAIALFIWSAIVHLVLVLFGKAREEFEATFRVACYAQAAAVLAAVPFCGLPLLWLLGATALMAVGIAETHQISPGTTALAVLVPLLLFCCCCGGLGLLTLRGLSGSF